MNEAWWSAQPWPEIEGAIFDLDGTVYLGDEPIPGAFEALESLRAAGVQIAFVTNNATRSREDFARKLAGLGFETDENLVVNSGFGTGELLRSRYPQGTGVYVVGAPALADHVVAAGFRITDRAPEVVVVGLDRAFTYAKLETGVRAILDGADFVATNPDRLLPLGDGFHPGAGTIVAAFQAATSGVTTPLLVGKPEPHLVEIALDVLGTPRKRTIMVGDQLETDIRAGQRAGLFSILVQTGVPFRPDGDVVPDRVIDALSEIPAGERRPDPA
jgi:4-nitrophenyl phosphatase